MTPLRKCTFKVEEIKRGKITLSSEMEGIFHQWGIDFGDLNDTLVQYTVGVIEGLDGQVHLVNPEKIQFKTD